MNYKILMTEPQGFSDEALKLLESFGEVRMVDLDREQLLAEVGWAHVLWVRLRHYIDGEILSHAKNLKWIVSPTTGLTHIDVPAMRAKGVSILSLKGEISFLKEIKATAEYTVALIFALLRNIPMAVEDVKAGRWDRDSHKGCEIQGKLIGIVGYGRIGILVAEYLRVFGARVIVSDPYVDPMRHSEVQFVDMETLLSTSDIVSLHVNLDSKTENLIGEAELGIMRRNSILINTSRGELVNEEALLAALRRREIAAAGLDVLRNEQVDEIREQHPLICYAVENRNLLITPHIGGCTAESMEKTELFMANKLFRQISECKYK